MIHTHIWKYIYIHGSVTISLFSDCFRFAVGFLCFFQLTMSQSGHLFVIIHGLWGGPSNVYHVEKVLQDMLSDIQDEDFYFLRPKTFGYFKTYDGIEACGNSTIKEIFKEIETLKSSSGVDIKSISIIGYSLGGLIARYCIGKFYQAGVFETIEPKLFASIATPHLGVKFWNGKVLDKMLNFMGTNLLSQSGRDLFIENSDIMVRLADPEDCYYRGLASFATRIAIANVKNDRTVPFYTAFMTPYNPFTKFDRLDLKYLEDGLLPEVKFVDSGKRLPLNIVDFKESGMLSPELVIQNQELEEELDENQSQAKLDAERRKKFFTAVAVLSPILLPVLLIATFLAILKSHLRIWNTPKLNVRRTWELTLSNFYLTTTSNNSISGASSRINKNLKSKPKSDRITDEPSTGHDEENLIGDRAEDLVDDVLGLVEGHQNTVVEETAKEKDEAQRSNEKYNTIDVNFDSMSQNYDDLIERLKLKHIDSVELSKTIEPLPLDEKRVKICHNLNQLDWIKIPVMIESVNAHATVVVRVQMSDTFKTGISSLYLFGMIVKKELLKNKKEISLSLP